MSKLWNLLESRLSDWITLKDDNFSVYEVIEIVDYSLDVGVPYRRQKYINKMKNVELCS